jgi:hypothetical protein
VTKAIKTGLWTMLGGILGVFAGLTQGFGPCGPATPLGTFLFLGGMLAAVAGFLTVVIGIGWNLIRHPTH